MWIGGGLNREEKKANSWVEEWKRRNMYFSQIKHKNCS